MLLSVRSRPVSSISCSVVDDCIFHKLCQSVLPSSRRALPDFFPTMMVSGCGRLSSIETNRGKSRECAGGDCSSLIAL
jgi:hypothetical protein